jgi:hypothetical protein
VEEARVYSTYAKKKSIDIEDIKLAVKMTTNKSFTTIPPREVRELYNNCMSSKYVDLCEYLCFFYKN